MFVHNLRANIQLVAAAIGFLALILVILRLQERIIGRLLAKRIGWRAPLLTGWIGVPVHELSHLIGAVIFNHRIIDWRLFRPDPQSGTLGYVRHAHRTRTSWQLFGYLIIGLAPALLGMSALVGIGYWALNESDVRLLGEASARFIDHPSLRTFWQQLTILWAALWAQKRLLVFVQLYLSLCIASHLAPSRSDFRCAGRGLVPATAFIFISVAIISSFPIRLERPLGLFFVWLSLVVILVGAVQLTYLALVMLATHNRR